MYRWLLLLAALALVLRMAVLIRRYLSESRRGRAARAAGFAEVEPLLASVRSRLEPSGFRRLAGRFAGHAVDLQAVPDTLSFRKLPALWLLATLTERQPLAGETRIMMRPTGHECFSAFGRLGTEVRLPPGFPVGCVLRTTAPGHLPPATFLAGLARLFEDPATKEVVLSPEGLRLVRLAEEGERGAYVLFRESDLGQRPIRAPVVKRMLETLVDLSGELARA